MIANVSSLGCWFLIPILFITLLVAEVLSLNNTVIDVFYLNISVFYNVFWTDMPFKSVK